MTNTSPTTIQCNASTVPQWWGMAGIFPGELGVYNQGDAMLNKLNFIADRGFHGGSIHESALSHPTYHAALRTLCQDRGQAYCVHYGVDLRVDTKPERTRLLQQAKKHIQACKELDLPLVQISLQQHPHRFMADFPLEAQLSATQQAVTPMVEHLAAEGIPVAIENHGDYYISDLVGLCHRVPGLSIMLDTGNCFLIGERPDLIPDEAFPLISSTHFKDHLVTPDAGPPLRFNIHGATLGQGHVGLDTLYEKLLRLHPDPASIYLMTEWVPDASKDTIQCLNESLDYLAKLSAGNFQPNHFHA